MRELPNQIERALTDLMAIGKAVMSARSICADFGLSLLVLGAWSGTATAESIAQATIQTPFQEANLGRTGKFWSYAYSKQNQNLTLGTPQVGPNATTGLTAVLGGTPRTLTIKTKGPDITVSSTVTGVSGPSINYPGEKLPSVAPEQSFTDPVWTGNSPALTKRSLSTPGDNVEITSTSGMYKGRAAAVLSLKGVRFLLAQARIFGTPPPQGAAAAKAYDPFEVPSGSIFGYDPTVTASVELDSPGVAGGFAAFAVDSSVFVSDSLDNFVDDGSPLDQTLWYLAVGGDTPTTSTNAVRVDFQLNPLALNEIQFSSSFLASLGPFSDTVSEALLIDQAIDRFITSQLALNGADVALNDVHLFPAGTTFSAIAGGVEYADDVDAVVTTVPELGTLSLLGIGLAALALSRSGLRRWRAVGRPGRR